MEFWPLPWQEKSVEDWGRYTVKQMSRPVQSFEGNSVKITSEADTFSDRDLGLFGSHALARWVLTIPFRSCDHQTVMSFKEQILSYQTDFGNYVQNGVYDISFILYPFLSFIFQTNQWISELIF